MYDVLDVCRYVINYSNEKGYGISNLKLQKLLYFIQAYFLMKSGKPCFDDDIEAWAYGPVVPRAYREYQIFGGSNIPKIKSYYRFDTTSLKIIPQVYDASNITGQDAMDIMGVVDVFKKHSAIDLMNLTHSQAPWKAAYAQGRNSIISKKSIREYFNEEK